MEFAVIDSSTTPWTRYHAAQTIDLASGKHLKIETSPSGMEILDAVVPAGKTWTCSINVIITETDA